MSGCRKLIRAGPESASTQSAASKGSRLIKSRTTAGAISFQRLPPGS